MKLLHGLCASLALALSALAAVAGPEGGADVGLRTEIRTHMARTVAALQRKDIDAYMRLCTPDVKVRYPGGEWQSANQLRDNIAADFAPVKRIYSARLEIDHLAVAPGILTVEGREVWQEMRHDPEGTYGRKGETHKMVWTFKVRHELSRLGKSLLWHRFDVLEISATVDGRPWRPTAN